MVSLGTNRNVDSNNQSLLSNAKESDTLVSLSMLRRYSQDQKYKNRLSKEADANLADELLFFRKENIPDVISRTRRPFMGFCCQNCTFTSRTSLVKSTTEKLALTNILCNQICTEKYGLFPQTFSHICQIYGLKRFNYPQVAHLVLREERVVKAVEKAALHQFQYNEINETNIYQELVSKYQKRANQILFEMSSTVSDFLLKVASWILYKLFPKFLNSVVVHPGQVKMIQQCSNSNIPLIFLPLHRSHLDYVLLSFILLNNNLRPPLVAVGDNLKIKLFGTLFRKLGAFFVKRRIDSTTSCQDYVYRSVLHTYINLCLRAGHNIEFCLEGGRTRTGKACMPKYGLFSIIIESFMDGTIEDALLVPVNMNYDKLVDGNFIREQLDEPKKKETLGATLKGIWHVLSGNFGMVRVNINQPFSLRELIKSLKQNKETKSTGSDEMLKSHPSTNSLYGIDIVSDEHQTLVEDISKHLIYDGAQSTSIMSTNALAFLLLTKYRTGTTLEKLVISLDNLKQELESAGKDVGFVGEPVDIINYAVDLLGPALVKREKQNGEDVIKPVSILPNIIELSYYSNSLVAHFALESVIALALSVSKISLDSVAHDELMKNSLELCDILRYEFLFCKPCQDLEQVITSCIDDLATRKDIFLMEEKPDMINRSRKLAAQFEDDEIEPIQKLYKLNQDVLAVNNIQYLKNILMPLVETYALTAFSLDKLVQRQLLESELIANVLEEMKNQSLRGTLKFDESIGVDAIKNALKLFQKWGVLECHSEGKLILFYLKECYDDTDSVLEVYGKVNKYRISNFY